MNTVLTSIAGVNIQIRHVYSEITSKKYLYQDFVIYNMCGDQYFKNTIIVNQI